MIKVTFVFKYYYIVLQSCVFPTINKVSETIFLKLIKNVLIYLYLFALAF